MNTGGRIIAIKRAVETPNNLRVEVTCDVCGNLIPATLRTLTDGVITIQVMPCRTCVSAAYRRGQIRGLDDVK